MGVDDSSVFNLPIPVSFRCLDIGHGFVEFSTSLANDCIERMRQHSLKEERARLNKTLSRQGD